MCPFINVYVAFVTKFFLGTFFGILLSTRLGALRQSSSPYTASSVRCCASSRAALLATAGGAAGPSATARPWAARPWKTVEQRHERWAAELDAGHMVRRTEAFMQSYTPKKYAFRKPGSGRLVASTHLAAPAPQTIDRGDTAETENAVVSVKT